MCYLILDCYVDEPACLGVPPFIAHYPRYIYGALLEKTKDENNIDYLCIDTLRKAELKIDKKYKAIFLIGGAVVPGKYLGSAIATISEINRIISQNPKQHFYIGGAAAEAKIETNNKTTLIKGDPEKFAANLINDIATSPDKENIRNYKESDKWSKIGTAIVKKHFDYPNIICEIETGRGCPRSSHCSFCYEGSRKNIDFRDHNEILNEIELLADQGITRFRLGRQADILSYGSELSTYKNSFSKPNISAIHQLFSGLRKLKEKYHFKTLNIDNGNPGTIINFPKESVEILKEIAVTITPGDTLALGFESFDPEVIKKNNLKCNAEEALKVIEVINNVCGKRVNGLPTLLPGINIIQGLSCENKNSFKQNYLFLKKVLDNNLLLKRINIRKLTLTPGTALWQSGITSSSKLLNRFDYYKSKIRHEIDKPMLKKIYPIGTILKDMRILDHHQGDSLGKQIMSYAITAKFPMPLPIGSFKNAVITGHRERSLTVLPLPIPINQLDKKSFAYLPGVNKNSASSLVLAKPFKTTTDLLKVVGDNNEFKKIINTPINFD